jgi:hypothetical protein
MSMLNDAPKPRIPDSLNLQKLKAMQYIARLKESADKYDVGFIGGFVDANGEKFIMTNMNEDDTQTLMPKNLK